MAKEKWREFFHRRNEGHMTHWITQPAQHVLIERWGYKGFLSMIWMLWKMNRQAKLLKVNTEVVVAIPVRWLR